MGEEIREFNWAEERERRKTPCSSCPASIKEGYVYYDLFGFAYCQHCYFGYEDLGSKIRESSG